MECLRCRAFDPCVAARDSFATLRLAQLFHWRLLYKLFCKQLAESDIQRFQELVESPEATVEDIILAAVPNI